MDRYQISTLWKRQNLMQNISQIDSDLSEIAKKA